MVAFPASATEPAKVTYADHVLPLLRDKCLGCHNADKARGGLDASTYVKLMEGGSSGTVVKPGDPDDSRLFLLAAHKAEPKMPPKDNPIPAEQLSLIKRWIEQGALETAGSKAPLIAKKSEVALVSITKSRPAGPPPLPRVPLSQAALTTPRPAAVTALAASPWAPLVAVAAPRAVLLFHADTLDLLGVLPFPHGQVNVLRFSRNGSLLLAGGGRGGKAGKVVVWNVADGRVLTEVGDEHDAVLAADISADQTQIALGGPSKVVRVYNTADGQLLREIKKHTDWVTAIEYSPDGVLLATADRSAGLFVWEAFTGREYFGLRGHTQSVTGLSWRDDANVLASASEDGTVRLWEMENGKQIKSWRAHGGGVESVRYAHDGRIVTCGRDRTAKLWDGNGTGQRTFEAFADVALRGAMAHDNAFVIAGDWTGTLRAWSAADGKRLAQATTSPLPPAQRLAAAEKELAIKGPELAKAVAALGPAQAAAQKANQELAAAQKAADDTATVAKVVAGALADAKAAAEKAHAPVQAAHSTALAREVKAKAFGEAAAKIKDAAGKAPANAELQQAAAQAQQLAAQAETELTGARKTLADATAAAKGPAERLTAAQRAAGLTAGPAQAAAQALVAKRQAAKAANDAAAATKAAVDRLTAEVNAARATVERLRSATVASK